MSQGRLKIKLRRSRIGIQERQRRILDGLGLRRVNQVVIREDRPEIRGMIFKVSHLVEVEKS
ncbi:MAG: 50S ribosomal protein L30 [candidate division NC10 bacterium]|nr:50S ribosomal protein L30 [candidate division NC10 bacterium]